MVTTAAIKRTFRRLADRSATARPPYAGLIDEAEAGLTDLDRAAALINSRGLDSVRTAVEAARRDGYTDLANDGEAAIAKYERLQELLRADTAANSAEGCYGSSGEAKAPEEVCYGSSGEDKSTENGCNANTGESNRHADGTACTCGKFSHPASTINSSRGTHISQKVQPPNE